MSDKSDETQSHNSGNEEQGTEDNQKVEQNAPEQPVDKNVKVLKTDFILNIQITMLAHGRVKSCAKWCNFK